MKGYSFLSFEEKRAKYDRETVGISPFDIGFPLIESSDKTIEEIYYFRWHTYCQQIKETPVGYVVTEFLPDVPWSGIYNTINCPAGHHFYEGRWLYDKKYLKDYARFWFTPDAEPRKYSFWAANSILSVCDVWQDTSTATELFEKLVENYGEWEKSHLRNGGLFYQNDGKDGMECSISGHGLRPTINSYMYADAVAIARIAEILGDDERKRVFLEKAKKLKTLINEKLWDENADFYKNLSENKNYALADVRELLGYIPWCYGIPEEKMNGAWRFLNDENYFSAPYGPTTAERNHPEFMKPMDHECLWNGPSWPFATSQTLNALMHFITDYDQDIMKPSNYFDLLKNYAKCHYIEENGKRVPCIDENIDPFTGEWLARKILHSMVPERPDKDRGRDYNHSTFCDNVISGIAGIRINGSTLVVDPLFDENDMDYFCADGIKCGDRFISIVWDKNGEKFEGIKGFNVFIDGVKVNEAQKPQKFEFNLSEV